MTVAAPAGLVPPRYLTAPEHHDTLGPEYAALGELIGFSPDAEQRLVLDHANAVDKDGRSAAFEVVVIAPRQNLKTGYAKIQDLGDLYVRGEALVVHSAHEFDTAAEALGDLEALIEGSDALRRRTRKITHGATPEIETVTGARLKFKTRTSGGGRGLSGRKVNIDEAYAAQAAQMGALLPIMLAQPDPQVRYLSSACRPESAFLWDLVQRGRRGDARLFYVEWCAPSPAEACKLGDACPHTRDVEGCGCDDPDVIRSAHPAITRGRIRLETVKGLRRTLPTGEYLREVMGWHDEPLGGALLIDFPTWQGLEDADVENAAGEVGAFVVETSLDRAFTTISAAVHRADGRTHLEVVDRRAGDAWAVARLADLAAKHPNARLGLDPKAPAGTLLDALDDAGLDVRRFSTSDVAALSAWLLDGIRDGRIAHGPDPYLDDAALGARKRNLGDGLVAIGRRASGGVDVTPLVGCAAAGWLATTDAYDPLDSVY